jgi:hypothetical protein
MDEISADCYARLLESVLPFRTAVYSMVAKFRTVELGDRQRKPERNVLMKAKLDDSGASLEAILKGFDVLALH